MEDLGSIELEERALACSGRDLEKLESPAGCNLELVNEKVFSLDESEDEDDENVNYGQRVLTQEAKLDRLYREYVSLTLNSNCDPIKLGQNGTRGTSLPDIDEEAETEGSLDCDFGKFDDGYSKIHRRYKDLKNYDEILKDPNYIEISPGRVYKRRTVPGVGPLVTDQSLVIYNCAFWSEQSSHPYDSSWLRHNTVITNLSTDSILPGLHELLLTTRSGEWSEAFIRSEAAFGKHGILPRIAPDATIFCLLEVTKVIPLDKISSLCQSPRELQQSGTSFKEFFEASDEARKRGNYYVEVKQFRVALQRYKSGIRILEALTYKNEEEEKQAKELLIKLYTNSARAANASGEPRLALAASKQALLLDEFEPKAHWNRTIAWKIKGHPDRALGAARRAMHIFVSDSKTYKTFKLEADKLKKQLQNQEADLKELHRVMGRAAAS